MRLRNRRIASRPAWASSLAFLVFLQGTIRGGSQTGPAMLKNLTLEELSQLEVATPSKESVPAFRSPVAIDIITGEDVRRAGATTIPDALWLTSRVEVAQIDSNRLAGGYASLTWSR